MKNDYILSMLWEILKTLFIVVKEIGGALIKATLSFWPIYKELNSLQQNMIAAFFGVSPLVIGFLALLFKIIRYIIKKNY